MTTRAAFHQELHDIEAEVIYLAVRVEQTLADAVQAVMQGNSALACTVIGGEGTVKATQRNIENRCITAIRLQAPVARDLRELVVRQRVAAELEQMDDHAVRIARQVVCLEYYGQPTVPQIIGALTKMILLANPSFELGRQ